MEIRFEADSGMDRGWAKIVTHPAEQEQWKRLEAALQAEEKRITVIKPAIIARSLWKQARLLS